MQNKHYLFCNAPICKDDPNPDYKNEVIWIPGENICGQKLYEKFQRKQVQINREIRLGIFRNLDEAYTSNDLENRSI